MSPQLRMALRVAIGVLDIGVVGERPYIQSRGRNVTYIWETASMSLELHHMNRNN